MLDEALEYLGMGYSVIPVRAAKKGGALVKWGKYQREPPAEELVRRWFSEGCRATGVAIVTGAVSRLAVLDLDVQGEDDGERVAREVHGWEPEGPLCRTGGGGLHAYYARPLAGRVPGIIGLEPGIDLKCDGGFVYAPPSLHPSGQRYEWIEPLVPPGELPALPRWVLDAVAEQGDDEARALAEMDEIGAMLSTGVAEGERNSTAARIAGRYFAMGVDRAATRLVLQGWNARNRPPLPDEDLDKVLDSIEGRERAKRGEAVDGLDRETMLQGIGQRLAVPLHDIKRIGGSQPHYRLEFDGRYADVPARDIGSQWAFDREIIALTGHVPKMLKGMAWRQTLQTLLDLASPVEPGPEATEVGELTAWLQVYLEASAVRDEGEESSMPEDPRREEGRVHVHAGNFRQFVRARFDVRVEHKRLVQQLSVLGFERRTVNVSLPRGKRTTRSMWAVPEQFTTQREDA